MRQYFSRLWYDPYLLYARGPGLCPSLVRWSVICCQDGYLMAFAKGALPEEYLCHNFDEQCLGGHQAYLMTFLPLSYIFFSSIFRLSYFLFFHFMTCGSCCKSVLSQVGFLTNSQPAASRKKGKNQFTWGLFVTMWRTAAR